MMILMRRIGSRLWYLLTKSMNFLAGNYYNWTAATAGSSLGISSGDALDSICPKGWRLPASSGDKSFQNLMEYGYGVSASAGGMIAITPLSFLRSGSYYWSDGNRNGRGYYGYYWSSTSSSDTGAYYLYFSSSSLYYRDNDSRGGGFTVRCVAR